MTTERIRSEIKYGLYIIALGISLTVYAHQNFATKEEVKDLKQVLNKIDQRVYDIHTKTFQGD